jgi:hypothetical protein
MADVKGTDIPKGKEVKWYAGGDPVSETVTVSAAQVSAGGIELTKTAEYCSVVGTVNGVVTSFRECKTNTTTDADEADGCTHVTYAGIAENDVVILDYVTSEDTDLIQVMASQDVSCSSSGSTMTAAVNGQANKVTSSGTVSNSATMDEMHYNQAFVGLCLGDRIAGSPSTGKEKWTNKYHGMKKIGALIGVRVSETGTILYKWFLIGATANTVDSEFPTEDHYKRSMSFDVDYFTEAKLA